jgi:hypothetical protein
MAEQTSPTGGTTVPETEKTSKLELIITILLGAATVLGALAAYSAALWGGEQQSSYARSIAGTNEANTVYLEALNDLSAFEMYDLKDDILYTQWKDNSAKGDVEDANYFFSKLSPGLQKDLSDNPADVSEYEREQQEQLDSINAQFKLADEQHDAADSLMNLGNIANKRGDDFTLCTVLFTVVLFFLGLASLKTKPGIQKIYVIIACVIFVLSVIRLVTIPFPG